ncbi:MAG: hypothetical protein ACJA1A_001919 [Saprospiraceae bacterium]
MLIWSQKRITFTAQCIYMKFRFKILLCCLGLFFFLNESKGQSSNFSVGGAHTLSLGSAGTMFTGIESIYTNPAGLTELERYGFDVSYDRRFNLSELATVSLAGAKKLGRNAIGVSVSRFGFASYSESRAGLTYARKLFDKVSIGGSFHYLGYNIENYGNASRFTFDIGLQSEINDKLSVGVYIFNPASIAITDEQDVPSRMSIGLRYAASKKARIYIDVSKTINRSPEFKFAVDYQVVEAFSFRGGANITQSSLHFGPAYHMKNGLSIIGGYSFDNRLGHTTGLSISYSR